MEYRCDACRATVEFDILRIEYKTFNKHGIFYTVPGIFIWNLNERTVNGICTINVGYITISVSMVGMNV